MAATDGGADGAIASDTPTYAALLDSDDLTIPKIASSVQCANFACVRIAGMSGTA